MDAMGDDPSHPLIRSLIARLCPRHANPSTVLASCTSIEVFDDLRQGLSKVPAAPIGDTGHGSLNVPIEHHPTIRYMVYNGYYKVMSNIPKMGQLPTPAGWHLICHCQKAPEDLLWNWNKGTDIAIKNSASCASPIDQNITLIIFNTHRICPTIYQCCLCLPSGPVTPVPPRLQLHSRTSITPDLPVVEPHMRRSKLTMWSMYVSTSVEQCEHGNLD